MAKIKNSDNSKKIGKESEKLDHLCIIGPTTINNS
jgi:hypothetical protein